MYDCAQYNTTQNSSDNLSSIRLSQLRWEESEDHAVKKKSGLQSVSFIVCSHFHWRLTNTFVLHYIHSRNIVKFDTMCIIHVGLTNGQTINIVNA